MTAIKAYELRKKSGEELTKQLSDLKHELNTLRVQSSSSSEGNTKSGQIRPVRKAIARVLTIMSEKERTELKAKYAKAGKRMPLDLRSKKTRAMRRALTPKEAGKKTLRQRKRELNFPKLKFVLKP